VLVDMSSCTAFGGADNHVAHYTIVDHYAIGDSTYCTYCTSMDWPMNLNSGLQAAYTAIIHGRSMYLVDPSCGGVPSTIPT